MKVADGDAMSVLVSVSTFVHVAACVGDGVRFEVRVSDSSFVVVTVGVSGGSILLDGILDLVLVSDRGNVTDRVEISVCV